ncbi:NERD domain-containing protein [Metabacillus sp. GX 13764]|uniref:nuclease-related domain-containing protein n=1 Tax=Metabacillus kandeliae TaxID=2900151 RepID=UPI001E4E9026|nr:nuclease-related domain-containing protein [Metabacillus kandeliae]MCD7034503.1 NERD domain-containing protein [Metabacillus kandeliae]
MIIKERTKPVVLLQLEALLRRLPGNHRKRPLIEADLARYAAGYSGEKSIDYHLSFLPEKEFTILHDLRLSSGSHSFQMDTLILHPNFILILEVKNITGTLIFDQNFHQLIRKIGDKEEAFPDPLLQASRHKKQLQQWLAANRFEEIPIEYLIVVSSPATIIKMIPFNQSLYKRIIHSNTIYDRVNELIEKHKILLLKPPGLKKLSRLLDKNHTVLTKPIMDQYGILLTDLIPGTACPKCLAFPMDRVQGHWFCKKCSIKSKNAHLSALEEYFLLTNAPSISNKEFRFFLNISSTSITTRFLLDSGLSHNSSRKNRVYLRKK